MSAVWNRLDAEQLLTRIVTWLPDVGAALVMLLVFLVVYRVTRPPLRGTLHRTGMDPKLVELLIDKIYKYVLALTGLVMALDQLGVNVATALAGLGIAGIAVGFAAQDSLANLISGFLIFWDKPFVVGDWIQTESQYGQVTDITLRSTRIRTNRNTFVVIPNKNIIDAVLENESKHGEMRVDVIVGIAYKEDVREARKVILAAVAGLPGVSSRVEPDVVVDELGGSSVNLRVRVWIDDAGQHRPVFYRVTEACKLSLDEAGIEIPFPHLQLFFDDIREPVWRGARELLRDLPRAPAGEDQR